MAEDACAIASAAKLAAYEASCSRAVMELVDPEEDDDAARPQAPKREYKRCTHGHASKKVCDVCSKEKRPPRKKKAAE
jgi:hypothetical protein